jgi:hypothetical protein
MSHSHFQVDPANVKTDVPIFDTTKDTPIETINSNFEEMALEEEEIPLLNTAQEIELVTAIANDVETERMQNVAHYGSLGDAVPLDDLPLSPQALFEDPYAGLENAMPMTDDKGNPIDQGRRAEGPPMIGTQADRDAVDMFIKGEIRTLTPMQRNLLIFKLQQEGKLDEAVKGQSSSPALNSFFNDLRRMQKQYPVVFGRHVKVKQRVSKTRTKGSKKKHK